MGRTLPAWTARVLEPFDFILLVWAALWVQGCTFVAVALWVGRSRLSAAAPRLCVYFSAAASPIAELVVENVGDSPALDLRLIFQPEIRTSNADRSATQFFDSPQTIPAHSRVTHAFDTWSDYFLADCPRRYEVAIRYRPVGKSGFVEEACVLDASGFEHQHVWRAKGLPELVETVEHVGRRVEQWIRDSESARRADRFVHGLEADERALGPALEAVLSILDLIAIAEYSKDIAVSTQQTLPALRRATVTALVASSADPAGACYRKPLLALLGAAHHRGWNFVDAREANEALAIAGEALRRAFSSRHEAGAA